MNGRLLTAREVADQLGVSPETVLRWAADGRLPSIRLSNRAIRFREAAIDAWLAARETGAAHPGGVSQPDGRAHVGGYAPLLSSVSANPSRARDDNPGGS